MSRRSSQKKSRRSLQKRSRRSALSSYVPRNLLLPAAAVATVVAATALRAESAPQTLVVATFNLFANITALTNAGIAIAKLPSPPDVVVFQETPVPAPELANYKLVHEVGGDHESMTVYVHNGWTSTVQGVAVTGLCNTPRYTQKVTIERNGQQFTIANVHLCGGRYDETAMASQSVIELGDAKTEMFGFIEDCDIVLGDFNSDLNHYVTGYVDHTQQQYLRGLGWTNEQIAVWNSSMYSTLYDAGFAYVAPLIANSGRLMSTTRPHDAELTPDVIWYKPDRLIQTSRGTVIPIPPSDHHGVYREFEIKQ